MRLTFLKLKQKASLSQKENCVPGVIYQKGWNQIWNTCKRGYNLIRRYAGIFTNNRYTQDINLKIWNY